MGGFCTDLASHKTRGTDLAERENNNVSGLYLMCEEAALSPNPRANPIEGLR